ncbi:hypothetical protein [Fibrivirga algicola]|uniref:Uncharacterized protein n=1 Tax=Fibrivirga algicola TaxID=2950420 RepID=A0ABX0QBV3_9BACT|nr:hypothetical protein [Fibrivirga algicola]NID09383.1 hypothetical protein [Fibrivirga algicola]
MKRLCKRPKDGYSSCPSDICGELVGKNIEDLIVSNNSILETFGSNSLVIKVRFPCKSNGKNKSGGFRVISFINKERQEITFLDVYPKAGSQRSDNLVEGGKEMLLEEYVEEHESGALIEHDLDKKLAKIDPSEELEITV